MSKDEIKDMLNECRIQLQYLDKVYPMGTTAAVLSRLKTFIEKYEKINT